jgi:pimeloyl-ACP methyl ester carboxylesterase
MFRQLTTWICGRRVTILAAVLLLSLPIWAGVPAQGTNDAGYYGNYRVTPQHLLGIDKFITDSGESTLLFSDYQSGIVRRLFPVSETEFVMGPGFDVRTPVELDVRFIKDELGTVTAISMRSSTGESSAASRVPLREENIVINNGPAKLAGILLTPATDGAHPAIILLHGSGPLTRYSFGPYPHFFTSLGFAVLIYDKRGTGESTGTLLDASTGTLMARSYYPDDLVSDALAALHLLQGRNDINSRMIGFWGSSEGGMLATQVAARSKETAFIIDSSGFMGPLWQTVSYQIGAVLRSRGSSKSDVEKATAFTDMWLRVARTGLGWNEFVRQREEMRQEGQQWFIQSSDDFASLDQMRWDWDHILTFSPLATLRAVTCPALAVYGEADTLTQVSIAVRDMRAAIAQSGNKNFTIKVFPNAGHSLSEMPAGSRMAPGVFETLRSWLLEHTADSVTHATP